MPILTTGQMVILRSVPDELLDGLPEEDQDAIRAIVGQYIMFIEYDKYFRAEFEFTTALGTVHTIWIDADKLDI